MEQLAAIEGRTVDEQITAGQAYLTTPMLVGREGVLASVRGTLREAGKGHGGSLLLSGASGIGRTRVLGAGLLEAKMFGALVLRAVAAEVDGDLGLMRALGLSLLEAAPELGARARPRACAPSSCSFCRSSPPLRANR